MRVEPKGKQVRREVMAALDQASLVQATGGLKSERVQGDGATGPGGGG